MNFIEDRYILRWLKDWLKELEKEYIDLELDLIFQWDNVLAFFKQ